MLKTNDRTVFNEDHELFRDRVRNFFDAQMHPNLVKWEKDEIVGRQFWLDCGEAGLLQLHGGAGYMNEYPIAQMWRDARVSRIYGGTNEIMKEVIGRSL